MKSRKYSVVIACDVSMLALLWGLNRVVMIFEIFKSLHKYRMTSSVNLEAQSVRIAPGDAKRVATLSTSALAIISASWCRIGMSVRYLDNCSLQESLYLFPFSINRSGLMQSILILLKVANGVSVISTAILVFEEVCLFFWHEAHFHI
jgi:hypothetical protein